MVFARLTRDEVARGNMGIEPKDRLIKKGAILETQDPQHEDAQIPPPIGTLLVGVTADNRWTTLSYFNCEPVEVEGEKPVKEMAGEPGA